MTRKQGIPCPSSEGAVGTRARSTTGASGGSSTPGAAVPARSSRASSASRAAVATAARAGIRVDSGLVDGGCARLHGLLQRDESSVDSSGHVREDVRERPPRVLPVPQEETACRAHKYHCGNDSAGDCTAVLFRALLAVLPRPSAVTLALVVNAVAPVGANGAVGSRGAAVALEALGGRVVSGVAFACTEYADSVQVALFLNKALRSRKALGARDALTAVIAKLAEVVLARADVSVLAGAVP